MAYTVKAGDTLSQIAKDHGMTLSDLLALNDIPNPDVIQVGQYINVTDTGTESVTSDTITVDSIGGQELNQIPGTPEVWQVGDQYYVTYFVPGTDPPVPMTWTIPDTETLQAFFGPDQPITPDRTMTADQYKASGAINFGTTNEIPPGEEDPFESFLTTYETEAQIRPWLNDPEIMTLMTMAVVEGRVVSEAELQTTEWWQTHSEAEREWLSLSASDPTTAARTMADNRSVVSDLLSQAGVTPTDELVAALADQWTTGMWSQQYLYDQIEAVALGKGVDSSLKGFDVETTTIGIEAVREIVQRWLGPAGADGWNRDMYTEWARKLQFEADAQDKLTQLLRNQRKVLLPGYDENLDYATIASTWRGRFTNAWGAPPNESGNFWMKAIGLNDVSEFDKLLRKEGIKRGNDTVIGTLTDTMSEALGGSVRQEII